MSLTPIRRLTRATPTARRRHRGLSPQVADRRNGIDVVYEILGLRASIGRPIPVAALCSGLRLLSRLRLQPFDALSQIAEYVAVPAVPAVVLDKLDFGPGFTQCVPRRYGHSIRADLIVR